MSQPEDAIAKAERHVRRAEEHVAHLVAVVDELERHNHPQAAERAKKVLATLRRSLELSRDHLRLERRGHGLPPAADEAR